MNLTPVQGEEDRVNSGNRKDWKRGKQRTSDAVSLLKLPSNDGGALLAHFDDFTDGDATGSDGEVKTGDEVVADDLVAVARRKERVSSRSEEKYRAART
jgi:hypothetical protein